MAAAIAKTVASVVGEVLEDVEEVGIPDCARELDQEEKDACKKKWPNDNFKYVVTSPVTKVFYSEVAGRLEVPIPVGFLTDGVSGGVDVINFINACAHDYMYAGAKIMKGGVPFKPSKAIADEVLSLQHRRVAVRVFGNGAWTSSHGRGIPFLQDTASVDLSASSAGLPKFAADDDDDGEETEGTDSYSDADSDTDSGQELVD